MFRNVGSVLGPHLFTMYVCMYVCKWFSHNSQYISDVIMFTDDNSVLIYDNDFDDFTQVFSSVLSHISKWLQANQLVLNEKKKNLNIVKFTPSKIDTCRSNSYQSRWQNFLVCNWIILLRGGPIPCIDPLLYKMSTVCFVIRRLFHVLNIDVLEIRYFAYFHSLMKYGVILGGKLN